MVICNEFIYSINVLVCFLFFLNRSFILFFLFYFHVSQSVNVKLNLFKIDVKKSLKCCYLGFKYLLQIPFINLFIIHSRFTNQQH